MKSPTYCRFDAYEQFAASLTSVETTDGLVGAAVGVAMHELESATPAGTEARFDELAECVDRRVQSSDPRARLAHLHDVLFDVEGFGGNTDDYYDPRNSYLPAVLASRRGIPISLVLVYKCVAERVGLCVEGVNAPGHFLARVEVAEDTMLVDPFYGGKALAPAEAMARSARAVGPTAQLPDNALRPATHRQWLARILTNLQLVFASTNRQRDLSAMQELQSLL